jgi:hypothetical protein
MPVSCFSVTQFGGFEKSVYVTICTIATKIQCFCATGRLIINEEKMRMGTDT